MEFVFAIAIANLPLSVCSLNVAHMQKSINERTSTNYGFLSVLHSHSLFKYFVLVWSMACSFFVCAFALALLAPNSIRGLIAFRSHLRFMHNAAKMGRKLTSYISAYA